MYLHPTMPPKSSRGNNCDKTHSSKMTHYGDVIMGAIASQITSLTIVYSIVYSDADQRKHQSSVSLAFVRGIHRGPVNSPHKWPVTRKMSPFDDVMMKIVIMLCKMAKQNNVLVKWLIRNNALQSWGTPSLIQCEHLLIDTFSFRNSIDLMSISLLEVREFIKLMSSLE